MNILLLCKRRYTNKDLLDDRFGRLFHLPVHLARRGARVTVLALDYQRRRAEERRLEGVTFRTLPATVLHLPLVLPTLQRLVADIDPGLVMASGDSHLGWVGARLAARRKVPFVFDVYDYYPAFAGNRLPGMKAMFRSAASGAWQVLVASDALARRLAPLNPRLAVVPNGVDRDLFRPGDRDAARNALGLAHTGPVIGYFGSLDPSRGPLLFDAVRQLADEMPGIRLLLAGHATITLPDEPWVTYLGPVSQQQVPELVAASDVVTLPYARSSFNDHSGACKIAEYLACQRPVVATRVADHASVFAAAPGALCEPGAEDMARAIRRQLDTPALVDFPLQLDWQVIGRDLHELLARAG